MTEEAVLFGDGGRLSGVISDPPPGAELHDAPAIVVIHAGRIHRVGPNRLYVTLARTLARLGFTVLRFDLSGIGESDIRRDGLPFHIAEMEDIVEAMDFLGDVRGARTFALMGICSGASLSAVCALRDPRVDAAVMINAQGYPLTRRQRLHAYGRKFGRYWWKIALRRPRDLPRALRRRRSGFELLPAEVDPSESPDYTPGQVLADLRKRGVRTLIVYSESDPGLDYLRVTAGPELRASLRDGSSSLAVVRGADHVFTLLASQRRLVTVVQNWFARMYAADRGAVDRAGAR